MTDNSDNNTVIGSINITPLVDILLVLLVIFMVTAGFLQKESVNIQLPKAASADPDTAQSLQVSLTNKGDILLDGSPASEDFLMKILADQVKHRPAMRVTLCADEGLSYGSITKIMGLIRKSGVTRISMAVQK
jgi:biopolymer transport protein ExbD